MCIYPSTIAQVYPETAIPLLLEMDVLRADLLAESAEPVPDLGGGEDHWRAKQTFAAIVQRSPLATATLMTQFYYKQVVSTRECLKGPPYHIDN